MFTVFTPTFNRKHTLPTLYQSLINQTVKNFEWLVIDDGSTDGTKDLIEKYIREQKIPVRYYFQKNQGKHIAINTSLQYIKGDYVLTVDSDDYLLPNAIEICQHLANEIHHREGVAGFTFFNYLGKEELDFSKFGKIKSFDPTKIKFNLKGENSFVLKTRIAKNYTFPVFEGEKFCQESLVFLPILRKYQILYTNHVLARGEYLEDGLSQNTYKRMLANPQYAMLTQLERIKSTTSWKEKKQFAMVYWDIANKNPQLPLLNKIVAISPLLTGITFLNKLIKRMRS